MTLGDRASSQRVARHQAVSRELGIEIVEAAWEPGTARTLEEIQERFDVSRTVARAAAQLLESIGLVSIRKRTGLVACSADRWNVFDPQLIDWRLHSSDRERQIRSLSQLRIAVEPEAAESAARLAPIAARTRLLALAAEMRSASEAGTFEEYFEFDIEFHRILLQASGNDLFAALAGVVGVVLRGRAELKLQPNTINCEALGWHEEVADAIFRQDPERARRAMRLITNEVSEYFLGTASS